MRRFWRVASTTSSRMGAGRTGRGFWFWSLPHGAGRSPSRSPPGLLAGAPTPPGCNGRPERHLPSRCASSFCTHPRGSPPGVFLLGGFPFRPPCRPHRLPGGSCGSLGGFHFNGTPLVGFCWGLYRASPTARFFSHPTHTLTRPRRIPLVLAPILHLPDLVLARLGAIRARLVRLPCGNAARGNAGRGNVGQGHVGGRCPRRTPVRTSIGTAPSSY